MSNSSLILIIQTAVESPQEIIYKYIKEKSPFPIKSSDISWFNQEKSSLKIDLVRQIIQKAAFRSDQALHFFILLHFDLATIPAQNALLKLIEEPPADKQFVLVVNQLDRVLATIQSRCLIDLVSDNLDKELTPPTNPQNDSWLTAFIELIQNIHHVSYGQIIDLNSIIKDHETAKKLILQLLNYVQANQQFPLQLKSLTQSNLLKSYQLLEKNVNVKLVLDNCFFTIKKQTV